MDLQQKDNTHYRQPRLCCLRAYSGTYTGYVLKRGTVTYVIVRACAPFSPVARLCTTLRPQTLWRGYDRVRAHRHSSTSCGNPTHSPPSNTKAMSTSWYAPIGQSHRLCQTATLLRPQILRQGELKVENCGLLYKNVNPLLLTRSVNIDCLEEANIEPLAKRHIDCFEEANIERAERAYFNSHRTYSE